MAEKDATVRLRRAVKENNLFLVKRLIQRMDIRNPDPGPKRYTSLAWAAALGHEETFEFLLSAGHDDDELSRDAENNNIIMILADSKPEAPGAYSPQDYTSALIRMARLYYDRYSHCDILDWSNIHGKTALHVAALKGNEDFVRMLCDLGADIDLSDNKGNTPLHYASAWGHIPTVQLLIERGCQYSARNNEGSTPSDYAYSFSTRETLQETARLQYENNKKQRRQIFAQAAQRGSEWGNSISNMPPPPVPAKDRVAPRLRSGSGTSRTTATSDSGDPESFHPAHSSASSQLSAGSNSHFFHQPTSAPSSSSAATFAPPLSKSATLSPPPNPAAALSPIVNRIRERDTDAMEKFLRSRSGSSSTDTKSQNGSNLQATTGPTDDDFSLLVSGSVTPRKLRPSASAAQLQSAQQHNPSGASSESVAPHRSGTSPVLHRRALSPLPLLTRSSSTSKSLRSMASADHITYEDPKPYMGPSSQYARFPDPPTVAEEQSTPTTTNGHHRKGLHHILGKPLQGFDSSSSSSHRRGMSAASVRGS